MTVRCTSSALSDRTLVDLPDEVIGRIAELAGHTGMQALLGTSRQIRAAAVLHAPETHNGLVRRALARLPGPPSAPLPTSWSATVLPRLRSLELGQNLGDVAVEHVLRPCTSLRELNISRNGLTRIPDCLIRSDALADLDVRDNPITSWPSASWADGHMILRVSPVQEARLPRYLQRIAHVGVTLFLPQPDGTHLKLTTWLESPPLCSPPL